MKIEVEDLLNKKFLKTNSIDILRDSSQNKNRFSPDYVSDEKLYTIFDNVLSLQNNDQKEENKYFLIMEVLEKINRISKDNHIKCDNEIYLLTYLESRKVRVLRDNSLLSNKNWAINSLNNGLFFENNSYDTNEVIPYIYQKKPELRDFIKNVLIKAITEETSLRFSFELFLKYNTERFKKNFALFLSDNPALLSSKMVLGNDSNINFRHALYNLIKGVEDHVREDLLKKIYNALISGYAEINKDNLIFIQTLNFLNEHNENVLKSPFLKQVPILNIENIPEIKNSFIDNDKKTIKEYLNRKNENYGIIFEAYLEKETLKNKLSLVPEDPVINNKKRL